MCFVLGLVGLRSFVGVIGISDLGGRFLIQPATASMKRCGFEMQLQSWTAQRDDTAQSKTMLQVNESRSLMMNEVYASSDQPVLALFGYDNRKPSASAHREDAAKDFLGPCIYPVVVVIS